MINMTIAAVSLPDGTSGQFLPNEPFVHRIVILAGAPTLGRE